MIKFGIWGKLIENYFFAIMVITSLEAMMTGNSYILSILFPVALFIVSYKCGSGNISSIDLLFGCIVSSIIFSWLINSYTNQYILIFRCIMSEGAYMSAYFIGKRVGKKYLNAIFTKSIFPLSVCCILGIVFFLFPPGWYIAKMYETEWVFSQATMLEFLRLRSIFSSPYVMSYMCGLTSIYIFYRIFKDGEKNKKLYTVLLLLIVTMLLCMMRAPLSCVILSFFIALYYTGKYNRSGQIFIRVLSAAIGLSCILLCVLQYLDTDTLQFLGSKFDSVANDSDDLITTRINLWNYKYYLVGDGAGRHSLLADNFGYQEAIRDSEYVKILVEQGYIGLSLYILLLLSSLIKCVCHFRYLAFELCIILFFAVCMIGANPLSTPDKHCFLFWLTVGRIASFNVKKEPFLGI